MCVRTLIGTETCEPAMVYNPQSNKLQKAKEKYMKLHDDMVAKELQIIEQQKTEAVFIPELADDILRASTINYSSFLKTLSKYYETIQQTKFFKILFYTTQPAHIIMIAAVLCVTSALVPTKDRVQVAGHPHSRATSFIYLASFVMHLGAQIWMTFVSGLSLYFALPRHTFGEVQRILFPRYFTINACLSLITLLIFVKHHPTHTWNTEIATQVCIRWNDNDINKPHIIKRIVIEIKKIFSGVRHVQCFFSGTVNTTLSDTAASAINSTEEHFGTCCWSWQ